MKFEAMNTLEQLDYLKTLWNSAMPPGVETPADYTFISWIDNTDVRQLERVVIQTGKKMSRNLASGVELEPVAAARYCSSIIRHYGKNRRQVAT